MEVVKLLEEKRLQAKSGDADRNFIKDHREPVTLKKTVLLTKS